MTFNSVLVLSNHFRTAQLGAQPIATLAMCATLALLGLPNAGSAQFLGDTTSPSEDGLAIDLGLSSELRTGNVTMMLLGTDLAVRYRSGDHELVGSLNGAYAEQGEDGRFMNAIRSLTRYQYTLARDLVGSRWLSATGVSGILHYDRDEFRRREHLMNPGAAGFLGVFAGEDLDWTINLGYVFEFEKFSKVTDPDDPTAEIKDSQYELNSHRAWVGSEFSWDALDWLRLGQSLVATVPLDHCQCDTRYFGGIFVRIRGNEYVAAQITTSVIYDDRPAKNVQGFDARVSNSLVFSL